LCPHITTKCFMTKNDLEKYLREIYSQREENAKRRPSLYFIVDENGNSLGMEMFNGLLKKLANSIISKDSFILNGRGKVFVIDLPEPMSREQIKNTYLNKSVAIDYAFYDVIELLAANKISTTVGLLTKIKDED